jgi:hypothetical protein
LYINHLIVSLCSSPSATIMQSGRHKSVEANALYVDPTVQALAHRSKVLQYDPDRDGVQEDGKLVYIDVELAKEHAREPTGLTPGECRMWTQPLLLMKQY